MVKLTLEMILRKPSGLTKKKKDESIHNFLNSLTHLSLENRNLDEIGMELTKCPNLIALYLYDNMLSKVPELHCLTQLSSLYLQNNNLTTVDNLSSLTSLKKLYLGGNSIYVIEGMEGLHILDELHVENQRLKSGESLIFDSQSISAISSSLKILNVAGNNLNSLCPLESCSRLVKLNASKNKLDNIDETADVIKRWPYILKLDLTGNPMTSKNKYRDKIILAALDNIESLDGKDISTLSKQFLKGMQSHGENKKKPQMNELGEWDPKHEDIHKPPEHAKECVLAEGCTPPYPQNQDKGISIQSSVLLPCQPQSKPFHKLPMSGKFSQNKRHKTRKSSHGLVAPPSSSADFHDNHDDIMND